MKVDNEIVLRCFRYLLYALSAVLGVEAIRESMFAFFVTLISIILYMCADCILRGSSHGH